jgi:hypothetical protein
MTQGPIEYPMQPLQRDEEGIIRFQSNPIVEYLLDAGPFDMNHLRMLPFPAWAREQFLQLIGYSVCGFTELSYVREEVKDHADDLAMLMGGYK